MRSKATEPMQWKTIAVNLQVAVARMIEFALGRTNNVTKHGQSFEIV